MLVGDSTVKYNLNRTLNSGTGMRLKRGIFAKGILMTNLSFCDVPLNAWYYESIDNYSDWGKFVREASGMSSKTPVNPRSRAFKNLYFSCACAMDSINSEVCTTRSMMMMDTHRYHSRYIS